MRGSYPLAAANENWLHDSIVHIIDEIHSYLNKSLKVPSWDKLLPNNILQSNRDSIKKSTGLKKRFKKYEHEVSLLTTPQRQNISKNINDENDIVGLISGYGALRSPIGAFASVEEILRDIFVFAFGLLTTMGVRDRQYRLIFNSIPSKICIFCGFGRMKSPQESRQDLDHYLPKSIYPFAAANMRNLVPACIDCNRDYKNDIDVISGSKRDIAFDPYNSLITEICLKDSLPFEGIDQKIPAWTITFEPNTGATENWDRIFCIKIRYSRDLLNHGFDRWINSFFKYCIREKTTMNVGPSKPLHVLQEYYELIRTMDHVGVDFLKVNVFEMLIHHYQGNNIKVINFIDDIVLGRP